MRRLTTWILKDVSGWSVVPFRLSVIVWQYRDFIALNEQMEACISPIIVSS